MTDNLNECYYCGSTDNVELHHCIHGSKELKKLCTAQHLLVGCCPLHHRGINGVHGKYGEEKDLRLQALAQETWEQRRVKKGKSDIDTVRDDWIKMFGTDYIKKFEDYIAECMEDLVPKDPDEEIMY